MDYVVEFSDEFEQSIKKLKKRDKVLFEQIQKKLLEIMRDPEHYKPLRNVLAGFRRLHFGSFVVIYRIEGNTIRVWSEPLF